MLSIIRQVGCERQFQTSLVKYRFQVAIDYLILAWPLYSKTRYAGNLANSQDFLFVMSVQPHLVVITTFKVVRKIEHVLFQAFGFLLNVKDT